MICAIGDSHTAVFSGHPEMIPSYPPCHNRDLSVFKTFRIGASTAYNLYKRLDIIQEIVMSENVDVNDMTVILVVGEIDCRMHIPRINHINGTSIDSLVEDIVKNTMTVVDKISKMGAKVVTYSCPGSTWLPHKVEVDLNWEFPRFGTETFRNTITRSLNQCVKKASDSYDIKHLDISKYTINEDNTTNRKLYMDDIHLDPVKVLPIIMEECKNARIL